MEGMTARLAIALLAFGAGCARDSENEASLEVLEILAAHRLDTDPSGMWVRIDEEGAWMLSVQRQEDSGRWTLRRDQIRSTDARGRVSSEPADVFTTSGDLASGILILDSPLDGSTRLHLCRFGGDDFLLPENTVRFENASARRPRGAAYESIRYDLEFPPVAIVESLPAGTWEAVDCPEWTWLEIRPTGADGSYRVRCSRRQGDDPTPVNSFARAIWKEEVLALDSPIFANTSWCLRRFAEEDWLLPRAKNRAEEGDDPEPEGMRFRLVSRATRVEGHILMWDGVDFPEEY